VLGVRWRELVIEKNGGVLVDSARRRRRRRRRIIIIIMVLLISCDKSERNAGNKNGASLPVNNCQ
jgi:hypothetical protein